MEKKNVVFLTVLAVATLLTAVVGTTFAYFTATVTNTNTPTATTVTTAGTVSVTYDESDQITATDVVPGWAAAKEFSVENTGNNSVKYSITLKDVTNGISAAKADAAGTGVSNTDDFVYALLKKSGNSYTDLLTSNATTTVIADPSAVTSISMTDKSYSSAAGKAKFYVTQGSAKVLFGGDAWNVKVLPATGDTELLVNEATLEQSGKDEYVLLIGLLETGAAQNNYANGKQFTGKLSTTLVTTSGVKQVTE